MAALLLLFAGLVLFAGGDKPASSTSLIRETLTEPPDASVETADFLIELTSDGNTVKWTVFGRVGDIVPGISPHARPQLGTGDAPSRDQAIDEADDVIDEARGKLPQPINRHGLRMAADCKSVAVQNLEAWIGWTAPKIDAIATTLAKQKQLTGAELQRRVFAKAFPECADATPKIRGRAWAQVTKGVQKIVDRELAGEFLDLHPLAVVLAARMVAMSPPKLPGAALWHDKDGKAWAVLVDQAEDGWRWRVWQGAPEGDPYHGDLAASQGAAVQAAKAYIDSLQTAGVAFNP